MSDSGTGPAGTCPRIVDAGLGGLPPVPGPGATWMQIGDLFDVARGNACQQYGRRCPAGIPTTRPRCDPA